jgi:ABC-type amino acid transport substrate-binding protein
MRIKARHNIILNSVFGIILFWTVFFLSVSSKNTETSTELKKKGAVGAASLVLSAPIATAEAQKPKDTLVIAISSDFEPFTFVNAEGKPAGMFVDIWRVWAQKTGKQIEFISSDWKTSLENLKYQKADFHSGFLYSPEQFEWISGSALFYESGVNLFYPLKQGKISDIKELSGQTVAALRGSQLEKYLIKYYPDIQVLACDTREDLVKVSQEGKTKGFIAISQVGASIIDRMGLSGEFDMHDKTLYR